MKPLVSVVITSYNYAKYICTAIDSVLKQDYDNLEVVVTDNCSTDETLAVLERYAGDRRVRINVNSVNIGITPNINVGIGLTRGEYVVVLSADDWLLPGHLRRLVSVAEEHAEVAFVYATAYLCNDDRSPGAIRHVLGQTLVDYAGGREELGWLFSACYMCLPTILFRRELFSRYGMLDESFEIASDWEITVRMALAGAKAAYVPVPLVGVRIHDTQASGVSRYVASGADFREHLEILEKYYDGSVFERSHGRELRIANSLRFRRAQLKKIAPEKWSDDFEARTERILYRLSVNQRRRSTRKPPKVAVIVTSSGRVNSLGGCLQSLARQSYPHWEAWLLQDQGYDLSGYAAQQLPREKLHYSKSIDRLTPAVIRTQGLYVAGGDYYLFLDEDSQLLPDHLERLVAAAESGDGVAIAGTIVQFNAVSGTMGWHPLGNTEDTYPLRPTPIDLLVANCVPLSAVLFDAAAADALEAFEGSLGICADWDFVIRLSRLRRLSYTGTKTLVEHAFLGLSGQFLSWQWSAYPDRMAALYERYPPQSNDVVAARERHHADVTAVLRGGTAALNDVQQLFRLYNVLAGTGSASAVPRSA